MKKLLIALMAAVILMGCEKEDKKDVIDNNEPKPSMNTKGFVFDPDGWEITGAYFSQYVYSDFLFVPKVTGDTLKDTTIVVFDHWQHSVQHDWIELTPLPYYYHGKSQGVIDYVLEPGKLTLRYKPEGDVPTNVEFEPSTINIKVEYRFYR